MKYIPLCAGCREEQHRDETLGPRRWFWDLDEGATAEYPPVVHDHFCDCPVNVKVALRSAAEGHREWTDKRYPGWRHAHPTWETPWRRE